MHNRPTAPAADPLPWVTAQMERGRVFDQRLTDATRMRAALDVLTANVAALHDDHPYRVVLSKTLTTAGTAYKERLVLVGSKPLYDDTLTRGQQAAVVMGLVLHEIGHVRWAREYDAALEASPLGNSKVVGAVSNLAADMHNERAAMDLFPGLAHAVEVAMWWVDKQQPDPKPDLTTVAGRANAALASCRYPWRLAPGSVPADWASTWADWAARAEQAGTPEQHVAIVGEALAIIRDLPDPEPEPQPDEPTDGPTGEAPQDEPGDDDDSNTDEPPTDEPTGSDGDDSDDEPTDDDEGQPSGGGDESDDDEPGDDDSPQGEGGDDGDDDGDDEGGDTPTDGGDDEGSDTGDDGDESGDGDGESDDGDDDGGQDGGSNEGSDSDSDAGGTGNPGESDDEGIDPTDEDSDEVQDACSNHAAHDDRDDDVQRDIEATLLRERTSGDTYVYRHSTSGYDKRTVKVAKKTRYGFNL